MIGDWKFCPRCATPLGEPHASRLRCTGCGLAFFANMGVGVAAVVTNARGDVLLIQRMRGQYGAGLWCLPCGYVDFGEDVRVAAAREAREEAGVDVEIGEIAQVTVNRHQPERPTVGIWFHARLVDPAAEPCAGDDAVAAAWFDPSAPPPLAFPTDVPVIEALAARRSR